MKRLIRVLSLVLAVVALPAAAVTLDVTVAKLAPEAPPFQTTALSGAQTVVRSWIDTQAASVRQLTISAAEESTRKAVASRFGTQSPDKISVETLVALTLTRAVQENEKDLYALAARIEAVNAAKLALRTLSDETRKLVEQNSAKPASEVCKVVNCGLPDASIKTAVDTQRAALVTPLQSPVQVGTVGELRGFEGLLNSKAEDLEELRADLQLKFQRIADQQAAAMRRLVELIRAIGAIRSTVIANLK